MDASSQSPNEHKAENIDGEMTTEGEIETSVGTSAVESSGIHDSILEGWETPPQVRILIF